MFKDIVDIVVTNAFAIVAFNVDATCAIDVGVVATCGIAVAVVPSVASRENPPVTLAIAIAAASCRLLLLYDTPI